MSVIINNPLSGLEIKVHPDDPIVFDEMLREMASTMIEYLKEHKAGADIRQIYEFAIVSALDIARKRDCSLQDWYGFAGYAGLLAAQSTAQQLWEANKS